MVILKLNPIQLDLSNNTVHTATDWEVSTKEDFSTLELSSKNDKENLTNITFNKNLDINTTYYARARILTNNGWTVWGNLDIFKVKDTSMSLASIGELPSKISIPQVSSSSDISYHKQSLFTIYAKGFDTIGTSQHIATSWIIEDIYSNVIWSKLKDSLSLTYIDINNIILKSNSIYRFKVIFHSSNNISSQVGCQTIKTYNGDNIILTKWLDTYDILEDLNIEINTVYPFKTLTYKLLGCIDNIIEEIQTYNTNSNTISINKDIFKYNNIYLLEITTDEIKNGTKIIPFRTITPKIEDLLDGDVNYDNYKQWLYENNLQEPTDEEEPEEDDKSQDIIIPGNTSYERDEKNNKHNLICTGELSNNYIMLNNNGLNNVTIRANDVVSLTTEAGGETNNIRNLIINLNIENKETAGLIYHSSLYPNIKYLVRYEVKLTNTRKLPSYLYYYVYNNLQYTDKVEFYLPPSLVIGMSAETFLPTVGSTNAPTHYKVFTDYVHSTPTRTYPHGYPYAEVTSGYDKVTNVNNAKPTRTDIRLRGLKPGKFKLYVIGEADNLTSDIKVMDVIVTEDKFITTEFSLLEESKTTNINTTININYTIADDATVIIENKFGYKQDNPSLSGNLTTNINTNDKTISITTGSEVGVVCLDIIGRTNDSSLGYKDKIITLVIYVTNN